MVNLHLVKFNENAKEIINSYVAESTSKAYKSALARFFRWHSKSSTPEKVATFEDFLNYAGILYKESGSVNIVNLFLFSLIAVGLLCNLTHDQNYLLKRFRQGLRRHARPRRLPSAALDIPSLLNSMDNWGENRELSTLQLASRCATLIAICGFSRPSDLARVKLPEKARVTGEEFLLLEVIAPKELRRGGRITKEIRLDRLSCLRRCPIATLDEYLRRTLPTVVRYLFHVIRLIFRLRSTRSPVGSNFQSTRLIAKRRRKNYDPLRPLSLLHVVCRPQKSYKSETGRICRHLPTSMTNPLIPWKLFHFYLLGRWKSPRLVLGKLNCFLHRT